MSIATVSQQTNQFNDLCAEVKNQISKESTKPLHAVLQEFASAEKSGNVKSNKK